MKWNVCFTKCNFNSSNSQRKLKILACLTREYNETTNSSPDKIFRAIHCIEISFTVRLKKTRLRDFRKKLILSSRMKREWGRGGRKIMQFNPGETEEIEKKKWEKEREGNRVMKLVGKKKKEKTVEKWELNGEEKNSGGVKMGDEKAIQRQSLTRLLSRGSSSGPGGKIFLQDPFESFRNNGSSFQSRWVKQGQKIRLESGEKMERYHFSKFFSTLWNYA